MFHGKGQEILTKTLSVIHLFGQETLTKTLLCYFRHKMNCSVLCHE